MSTVGQPRTVLLWGEVLFALYGWSWGQLSRLAELYGPTGISLRLDVLKRSEINLRRGICPAVPKELVSGAGIHHLERRRG